MPQVLNIEQKLADFLSTQNFHPEMKGANGLPATADQAKTFSFDYTAGSGKNYGTMVIILGDDNEMYIMYGDNLGKTIEDPEDRQEFYNFQQQLSDLANRNRWTSTMTDISKLKQVQAGIAAIKEGLFEGYYGTRRISYAGEPTEARLMIKHNRTLGENDARFRYVESVFIETVDNERFKLPFTHMGGARAMLEHVRQGGKPYDIRGNHIAEMVSELKVLNRFNRAAAGRVMEGVTQQIVEQAQAYYKQLKESLKHLGSSRGYRTYFETWHPLDVQEQQSLVEDIKTMFVEQTLDTTIEAAWPVPARIHQQGKTMKEADIFESWASRLVEGTWSLPETPEQMAKLKTLMSKELTVGPDATNATEQLYDLVGDDQLYKQLSDIANDNPAADVRWAVIDRLREMGFDVEELESLQGSNNQDAEQEPMSPTALEQGVAEAMSEPEQQQMDAIRRARLNREREPQGSDRIDAMLAQQNAQRREYEQTGKFWLKQKDTQAHISDAFSGKAAANQAALELLKQRPELKGNLVITAYGPGEQQGVAEGYSTLDLWNMSPKEVIELLDAKKITWDEYQEYGDLVIAGGPDEEDDFDYTDYTMRKGERGVAEGYTGRETKDGTWRVFKDGKAVAVAGPFKSREEAAAWIKKQKTGVAEGLDRMLKLAGMPVTEARILDESGETLEHILDRFKFEVRQFEQTGELDDDLYEALFDYYFNAGEMPYGTAKARTGDPYEWIGDRLSRDLGMNEADAMQTFEGDTEDAIAAFLARGGTVQQGKYHRPRKSEKTDYGSKHIGTLGGTGKPSKMSGTAANVGKMGKPVVTAEASACNHTMEGEYCPEHGLMECGTMESMGSTVAGSIAPVAEGSLTEGQYEMMMRNGQVKKFVAKDDADAKRIAAGHGAKSVIKLRGGVPAGKVAEQSVAEGLLAQSDEFKIELDDDGFVHLLDGENTVRVSMPVDIWKRMAGKKGRVDEFSVEVDDGQVHILDGEGTIRVSMPVNIWKQLGKQGVAGGSNDDPMNYNAAIAGSYYESMDPVARIKQLALRK